MDQHHSATTYDPYAQFRNVQEALWAHLKKVAPGIREIAKQTGQANDQPVILTDGMFIAFLASLANPKRREILASVLLDLLKDDLAEIVAASRDEVTT